jgi:hypothetical protein
MSSPRDTNLSGALASPIKKATLARKPV